MHSCPLPGTICAPPPRPPAVSDLSHMARHNKNIQHHNGLELVRDRYSTKDLEEPSELPAARDAEALVGLPLAAYSGEMEDDSESQIIAFCAVRRTSRRGSR
ncbi:unnamed protein product [Eretmochelys imbricata]